MPSHGWLHLERPPAPTAWAGPATRGPRCWLLLSVLSLAGGPADVGWSLPPAGWPVGFGLTSADEAVELSPGGNYRAGTRLRIPTEHLTFTIPSQWHATVFEDAPLPFLVSDEGRSIGMLFPLAHATPADVEDQLGQPLSLSHGVSFVPTGSLTRTENRLGRSYVSETTTGRALAVKGPSERWIIYFLMGPEGEAEGYDTTLEQLADSTVFGSVSEESLSREGV